MMLLICVFIFIFLSTTLLSCSQPYKPFCTDFVIYLEYPVFAPTTYDELGFSVNTGNKKFEQQHLKIEENEYTILCPIKCSIYKQENGSIGGYGVLYMLSPLEESIENIEIDQMLLTITHSNILEDTLWIRLNDDIPAFVTSKIFTEGIEVSEADENILHVGISEDFYSAREVIFSTHVPKYNVNPSFVGKTKGYNVFRTIFNKKPLTDYYEGQIQYKKSQLERLVETKYYLKNSDDFSLKYKSMENSIHELEVILSNIKTNTSPITLFTKK